MSDTVLLEDDYLTAARRYREIQATIKALDAEAEQCKEILAKAIAVGETGVDPSTGQLLVAVRPGARKFDAALAKANLPADIVATLLVEVVDAKKAKDTLAPGLLLLCQKENKPSVVAL